MIRIFYVKDGFNIVGEYISKDALPDVDYLDITDIETPNVPPEAWYIEDGQIKIDQQKLIESNRKALPALSKRQFALHLFSIKNEDGTTMYDTVLSLLNANPMAKIEYDTVSDIKRLSPTIIAMSQALGWSDEFVDEQWQMALQIK